MTGGFSAEIKIEEHLSYLEFIFDHFQREIGIMLIDLSTTEGHWVCTCPLVPNSTTQISLCKKEIPHHIKMSANAWSTKCR
jgi:hypothetical protein